MFYGYTRVSSVEQASADRVSLPDQERKVRSVALYHGISDIQIFSDPGVSGSVPLSRRPSGAQLLAALKPGDTLVAAKMDRIFRSASDALHTAEDFQRRGIRLILADLGNEPLESNGAAKFFFTIMSAAAEFERNQINDRIMTGKRGKRARGGHIGGPAPFGFRVIGNGRDAVLKPNAVEQEVIRLAAELAPRKGLRGTSRELARRGMLSRAGVDFDPTQIKRMIAGAL